MKKDKVNENVEVEVLIRDSEGSFGLGSTTISDNADYHHVTDMYQSRIDLSNLTDDAIREDLAEGKTYYSEDNKLLDAVNSILDFWLKGPINSLLDTLEFTSIVEALEYFKSRSDEYLIFTIKCC